MPSTKSTLYSGPRADMLHQGAGKWISPGQRDLFQHAPIMGYTSWASSTEKGRKAMTGRPFARRKQLSDDSDDEEDDEDDSFDAEWGRETSEAVEKRISIRPAMTTPSFGSNKPVHPTYTRKGPPPVRTLPTPPDSASSSTTDGRSPDVHNAMSNPWSRGSSKTHPSFSSAELDADRQRTPSFPTSPRAIRPRTTSDTASQERLGSPSKKSRGPRWHARTAVMARQEAVKALETLSRSGSVQAPSATDARGEDVSSSDEAGEKVADIGKPRTLPATPPADADSAGSAETSLSASKGAARGSVADAVVTRESPARAQSPMDVDGGATSGSQKEEAAGQGKGGTRGSLVMIPPERSDSPKSVSQASDEQDQIATEEMTSTARVTVQRAVSPIEVDGEGTNRAEDQESTMEGPCAAPLTASADASGRSQLLREAGENYRRFPDPFAALPSGSAGSTDQPTPPTSSNPPDRPLSAVGQSPTRPKTCLDIYNENKRAYQTSGRLQRPSDTTTARNSHQQGQGASHIMSSRLAGDSRATRPLHYSFDDEGYRSPAQDSDTDEDEPQSDVDVLDRPSVRQAAQPIRASTPAGHRSTTPRRTVPNPINAVPSPSNNNVRQAQGRVSAGTPRPVSAGPLPSGAGPGRSNPIIVVDSDNDDDDVEVQAIDSAVFNRSIRRSDAGGMTSSRGDRAATARRTSTSHSADQPVRAISGVAATRPLGSTSGPSGDIDRANVEVLVIPSSDPPEIDVEVEALADRPVKDNKTTRGRKVGGASGPDSAAGKSGDTAPVRKRVSESANRKRDARSVTFHRSASVASDTSDLQVRPDTPTKSVVAAATRSSGKARSVREGNQNHGLDTPHLGEAAAGMSVLENAVPLRATSRADGAPAPVVSIPVSTPIAKARTPPTLTRLARAIVPSSTEAGPSTRRIIADPDTSLPGPSNGGTAVAGHKADLSSRRAGLHPQMEGRRDGKFTTWSTRVIPGTAADLFPQLDKIYDGGKDRRLMKLHQETTWQVYGWTEQKRFFQICWNRMVRERNLTSEKKTVQARTAYFRRFIERYGELMRRAGVTHEFIDHLEFLKKHKHIANSTFATINELWEGDDAETA